MTVSVDNISFNPAKIRKVINRRRIQRHYTLLQNNKFLLKTILMLERQGNNKYAIGLPVIYIIGI